MDFKNVQKRNIYLSSITFTKKNPLGILHDKNVYLGFQVNSSAKRK